MNTFDIESLYRKATNGFPSHEKRPLIGITGNFGDRGCELSEGYWLSVERAGGIPVALPPTADPQTLLPLLDRLDGILLSGGGDVNPLFTDEDPVPALRSVNPRRDATELLLTKLAYDRQIPLFGICRGCQVLAIALGGSIHQDIATAMPAAPLIKHSQDMPRGVASHRVKVEKESLLHELLGENVFVNSFHHQAVNEPGEKLRIAATASDGVVEAIESNEGKSILGVQWHPECFILEGDESMMPLFRHFVEDAAAYRRARDFHLKHLTLDSHCDTPMFFAQGVDFDRRDEKVLVDLRKMEEGGLDATVMVAYLPQEGRSPEELKAATHRAESILAQIESMVGGCQGVEIARTPDELFRLKHEGKRAVMRGIENGYAIGLDIANIERFRRMGIVYMTLCHNGDNDICDSARRSNNEHGGLSNFGKEVVAEMNRTGMIIDLSHAAEATFYDVLALSSQPVVCSHSSARSLCNHPRNLTDDQLRALAAKGGVAQVTLYNGFLREEGEASINDAVAHLLHMINVAGIDHVGIGTDFDGDGGIRGLASASELINFTRRLQAEGFSDEDLQKIWGGNFLRVMRQVQDSGCIRF